MKLCLTAIFLIFFISSPSSAQECSYVEDDSGVIETVIRINGEVFFIFDEGEARSMAKKLENYELTVQENKALISKIDLLEAKLELSSEIIDKQTSLISIDRESIRKLNDIDMNLPWYRSPEVTFLGGFMAGVLTVVLVDLKN